MLICYKVIMLMRPVAVGCSKRGSFLLMMSGVGCHKRGRLHRSGWAWREARRRHTSQTTSDLHYTSLLCFSSLLPLHLPPSSPQAPDLNSSLFSCVTARCIIQKAQTHTQPRYEQTRTHSNPLDRPGHISCVKKWGCNRLSNCLYYERVHKRKRSKGRCFQGCLFTIPWAF